MFIYVNQYQSIRCEQNCTLCVFASLRKTKIQRKKIYFTVYIKIGHIYKDIAKDAEKRFDTSTYKSETPLPKEKNPKVIGLMKGKINWKNHEKVCWIKSKSLQLLNR